MTQKSLAKPNAIIYLAIFFFALVSSAAVYAEPAKNTHTNLNTMILDVKNTSIQPQSAQEALAVADHLNSISKAIQSNQKLLASGSAHDSINITIINKVKAIIQIIEIQRKKLVDLITSESISNTSDPDKLNSIIKAIDAQRSNLSNLIAPEPPSTANTQIIDNIENPNHANKEFAVFNSTQP